MKYCDKNNREIREGMCHTAKSVTVRACSDEFAAKWQPLVQANGSDLQSKPAHGGRAPRVCRWFAPVCAFTGRVASLPGGAEDGLVAPLWRVCGKGGMSRCPPKPPVDFEAAGYGFVKG